MAQLPPLISFTAGSPAVAGDVNQNFTDIRNHLNGANVDTENIATTLLSRSGGPILNLSQLTENQIAFNVENSQTNTAVSISQLALLATGKSILKLSETVAQTQGDAQLFLSLQSLSTIPAIHVTHGGVDSFKLTKDSLNLFNDSTKVSSDRIKLPVKTTVQRNAIVSPEEGSLLYNSTNQSIEVKKSTNWETISSPVGSLIMFAGNAAPTGWLLCQGQEISQSTYADLYAIISSTFNTGGEAVGNFRLPDMRRKVAVGAGGTGSATLGNAVGNSGGGETVTLTTANLPSAATTVSAGSHNHSLLTSFGGAFSNYTVVTTGNFGNNAAQPIYTTYSNAPGSIPWVQPAGAHTHTISGATDTPTNNIQPSLVLNYIIKY